MTIKLNNEPSAVMPRVLIEQSGQEKAGILAPWYRLSSPKEPPADADLAARELFRVHAHDLQLMLGQSGYSVLIRPIIIQILVAIVAFLWVRSTQRAIARADRAEVIAQLEHAIAQQEHKTAQEKRQLEISIRQIVQAHTQIANGDYNIRIPLVQGNVLWQIAGSLNNLLARLQRYRHDSQQHQQMLQAIDHVTVEVRRAKSARQSVHVPRTGTPLDALLLELNTPGPTDVNFDQYSPSLKHPPELYR